MEILENEKTLGILQGSCGDKNFGFSWYETSRTDDNYFIYGKLQITLDNEELLDDRTYDLNIIFRYLKNNLKSIKEWDFDYYDEGKSKEELYFHALRFWGHWTYEEIEAYDRGEITQDDIENAIDDYWENKSDEEGFGGYHISPYYDISDQGWQFFLFRNKEKERLLCSNNHGKTVLEAQLPLGTVEKVLSELPNC